MTDLLDTIHDLQREVKALKALGDTSEAVTASVQYAFDSYSTVSPISGNDTKQTTKWTRYPGINPLTIDFTTVANSMAIVDITGQAELIAFGNIDARYAICWRVKRNDTTIYEETNLGADANKVIVGVANLSALGGGWSRVTLNGNTTITKIGGGGSYPMHVSRIVKNLAPHTTYTVEAFPSYSIDAYNSDEAHNKYSINPISTEIKVTNITGE